MYISNSDFSRWECEKLNIAVGDLIGVGIDGSIEKFRVVERKLSNGKTCIKLDHITDDDWTGMNPDFLVGREYFKVKED